MFSLPDKFYFLYFIICILVIFLFGRYRCMNIKKFRDPLETSFNKTVGIDGWSSTHLFFYMFIGYNYPKTFYLTTFFGILWELFETYVGIYKPSFLYGWGYCKKGKTKKVWWYGKYSDIIVNIIGFLIGQYIALSYVI